MKIPATKLPIRFSFGLPTLSYFKEVRLELSKVVWPKKTDVVKLTLLVILISGVVGIYLGGLDLAMTKLLEVLIKK